MEEYFMKIAIPVADGKLCMHFGHCQYFALLDLDKEEGKVTRLDDVEPPPHEPGLLPKWLAERGVECVIAGGMGQRAQQIFSNQGVKVIVGAPAQEPEQIAADYLAGALTLGENTCDH
jgi:predicted Fe-Mo cluster-binding NifX family protein